MNKCFSSLCFLFVCILSFVGCVHAGFSDVQYTDALQRVDVLANQGLVDTGFVLRIASLQDAYSYDHDILAWLSAVKHYAADIHSSVRLESGDVYLGHKYMKRNQKIFFDRYKLEGVNIHTFEVIGKDYAQDNSCVFYQMDCVWSKGEMAWEYLGQDYSIYGGVLYFGDQVVSEDTSVLEILGDSYARAGDGIYYAGKRMDVDVASVEYLGDGWVKDIHGVYYHNIITSLDPETVQVLGENYIKDSKAIYYFTQKMLFDVESFDVMPVYEHYVLDKNFVYFDNEIIQGADPLSFKVYDYPFAQDAHFVYEKGQKNTWLDARCFKVLNAGEGLIEDCNGSYKRGGRQSGSLWGRMKNLTLRLWSKITD